MKIISIFFISCLLLACVEPPSDEMVKAAAENCTSLHKEINITYNSGGGYHINCKDAQ